MPKQAQGRLGGTPYDRLTGTPLPVTGVRKQIQTIYNQVSDTSLVTVSDTTAPSTNTGTVRSILSWLANRIKAITGKSDWKTDPARTLEQCVDTSGLTAHTIPVATSTNTLGNSRITRNGLQAMIEIQYVSGDSTPTLFVGGATSNKTAVAATSNSGVGIYGSSTSNYGVSALSQTGTALNATAAGNNVTATFDNTSTGGVATFTRNVSGANTNAVVTVSQSHASATATSLLVNQAGNGVAVDIPHSGTGSNAIGLRSVLPSGNNSVAVWAQTPGSGQAVYALCTGAGQALWAQNTSSGIAMMGYATGSGYAGYYESARSGGGSVPTMEVYTNHTSDTQSTLLIRSKGQGTGLQVLFTANSMAGDMASMTHTGTSFTGNGYRVTLTSAGHGVKVLQQGGGKAVEGTINNVSNSTHAIDGFTNGTGVAINGKAGGTGRAAHFERDYTSGASAPVVSVKAAHTSDTGTLVEGNHIGSGPMMDFQLNGTTKFKVENDGVAHLQGLILKRTAVSGATHTVTLDSIIIGVTPPTGGSTITLPAANAVRYLIIKDEGGTAGTDTITISRAGTNTIEGATSITIATNRGQRVLYSDGAGTWHIIG